MPEKRGREDGAQESFAKRAVRCTITSETVLKPALCHLKSAGASRPRCLTGIALHPHACCHALGVYFKGRRGHKKTTSAIYQVYEAVRDYTRRVLRSMLAARRDVRLQTAWREAHCRILTGAWACPRAGWSARRWGSRVAFSFPSRCLTSPMHSL